MKFIVLIIFLSLNAHGIEPMEYIKKPDIKTETQIIGDKIFFSFGFKDLQGSYQEWSWSDDLKSLLGDTRSFGIRIKDPAKMEFYNSELPGSMFKNHPQIGVIPDYSKLVSHYYNSVTPLYKIWKQYITKNGLGQRESVELLLRFFQDFPYGVPPDVIEDKYISGLFVPPLSLQNGWADCDSKSLLMATVLAHEESFRDKMAMILVPGHAFLGFEFIPQVYDEKYKFQNRTFIVAEPTGLSRTPFGRKNSPYTRLIGVEPIIVNAPLQLNSSPLESGLAPLVESDCPDNGLLIDIFSDYENARIQQCVIKLNGEYVKHGPLLKYGTNGKPESKVIYNKGSAL
ncbi:MAG: hypothetical protein CME71_09260 [Halobacteriovorax sp.]|nr:hypothetical protein [Halobacteriovorax sp.]